MAYLPAPGTSRRCRGLSYTRTMKWDPDKLQADTLLPDDPRLHISTITANKVSARTLKPSVPLTEEQPACIHRAVMKGSS